MTRWCGFSTSRRSNKPEETVLLEFKNKGFAGIKWTLANAKLEQVKQMKAQRRKINSSQAFQSCFYVDGVWPSDSIGNRLGVNVSLNAMARKAQYCLANEDPPVAMAAAGYLKTLKDYTFIQFFSPVFQKIAVAEEHRSLM